MIKASPIALATITSILAFSGLAFAEETVQLPAETSAPTGIAPVPARSNIKTIPANVKEKRADLRDAAKDIRSTFKVETKDLRTDTKEQMREATSSTERRGIEKNAIEQRKGLMEARKASSTEIRDQRKDLIETRKENASAVRDRRKGLAREHVGIMEQRYAIAIKQFDNLGARIQSRIDKVKANGIDAGRAESALSLALIAIAQVKADARVIADLGAQIQSGDDAKALRPQIEAAVKKLNASVKSAHQALVAAGKALIVAARTQKPEDSAAANSPTQDTSQTGN